MNSCEYALMHGQHGRVTLVRPMQETVAVHLKIDIHQEL